MNSTFTVKRSKPKREFYIPKGSQKIDLSRHHLPSEVHDAVVYVSDLTDGDEYLTFNVSNLVAIGFHGKAQKPDFFNRFRNEEQMERQISEFVRSRVSHLKMIAEHKEKMKKPHNLKVGDILYSSWGYDQTNIDYYQVIAVTKRMVTIRSIAQSIDSSEGNYDYVVPLKDSFFGKPMKKLVDASCEEPYLSMNSYSIASPWDGTPLLQTSPYAGH